MNKIIKKDIKSNKIPYIVCFSLVIILTTLLAVTSNINDETYITIIILTQVISGILLTLILVIFPIYVMFANFLSDTYYGYIKDVKNFRKYFYYRLCYVFITYFLLVTILVKIPLLVTDLTIKDIFYSQDVYSIVAILTLVLIVFIIFMLLYYKTVFRFRVPIRLIIVNVLLVIVMAYTIFVLPQDGGQGMATLSTALSYFLVIVLIILTININKVGRYYFHIPEVIMLILFFIIAPIAIAFTPETAYYSNYEPTATGEVDSYHDTMNYEIYKSERTQLGEMLITSGYDGEYKIYLYGESNITATWHEMYYDVSILNPKTGEIQNVSYYDEEIPIISYENNVYDNINKELDICGGEAFEITDIKSVLKASECFSSEEINYLMEVINFLSIEVSNLN